MNLSTKLDEIIQEYGKNMRAYMRSESELDGIGYPMRWDEETIAAILQVVMESLPQKFTENLTDYDHGWNDAVDTMSEGVRDIKDRLEGSK